MPASPAALARFRELLVDEGLKFTSQRKAIAEVFFGGDKHLSLNEILDAAQKLHRGIGYATVYRTMRLLTDGGLATEHKFGEAQARYEPANAEEHHDHLICVECGVIVEFEDDVVEQRQAAAASAAGFDVVSHKHEVYVKCRPDTCRRPRGTA